ncbi:hydrogenase transcriptional regulatory (plasmid) [Afipia carboxidovorans OM5]|uniref:Hydrogenase transcriptional regulatory n=1 Tax=Afipia carboxidovorans (strain ATCC 49405 / DSM 1227 / KCTC 32145 / OM5) TaxID=504832 RepID=F8C117_AFIC5|nr:sigma-54 dependent transcriptional regulator [Afipia carboxidovorans]AEI04499.1 hydrogenase transcriptional regulatory [Afipia carboxidovorans OM4]AEI08127.1 hydrogenase transcriptional regulatory [Afipia carboxidovorans OM5]
MADTPLPAILVVDDEHLSVEAIKRTLEDDFEVFTATSGAEALSILENQWIQLVLCDQRMQGMSGLEVLSEVRRRWPEVLRVIITGYTDPNDIIDLVNKAGIYHFISKPWHPEELLLVLKNGTQLYKLQREHDRLSVELKLLGPSVQNRLDEQRRQLREGFNFDNIVRSPVSPLNAACDMAARIAGFDVPALILGETGTGKELIARAIHYCSLRSDKPFHAVNCGAIPSELLESELFGHRKGAFTGAHAHRIGLLEQAHEGTVFLDEIGDIPQAFQVKLLRFLQEGEIRPVGSNSTLRVDVRVIAATNRDIAREAAAGKFREDLYYRLAISPISIPPLRERICDVPSLANSLLERVTARHDIKISGFTDEALDRLCAYPWPGNVRELENQITRMVILAEGRILSADLIEPHILRADGAQSPPEPLIDRFIGEGGLLRDRVERMEARIIRETLIRNRGNKSRAAEELGLSRVGLRAKLLRYEIEEPVKLSLISGDAPDDDP